MNSSFIAKPNKSFWAGKKVLITGHTGFKGAWLSLWLLKMNAQVSGISLDPENPNSLSEISALRRLYEKYNSHIDFVTIYLNQRTETSDFARRVISGIKWEYYALDYGHSIWKSLNIGSFPYYILVKDNLQIKGLPALGPTPNGVYETIERTFHDIKLGKG